LALFILFILSKDLEISSNKVFFEAAKEIVFLTLARDPNTEFLVTP
jgi:hypothetical protein